MTFVYNNAALITFDNIYCRIYYASWLLR